MLEATRTDRWLHTLLSGDVALAAAAPGGVHADIAPASATFPLVVFSLLSARDVAGVGAARIMTDALYLVKVVGKTTSYIALEVAADRIDVLLHAAPSAVAAGGRVLDCVREETVKYLDVHDGVQYRHLGARFRIHTQPA